MLKSSLSGAEKAVLLSEFDQLLGFDFKGLVTEFSQEVVDLTKLPEEVRTLLDQRKEARANKNWQRSDELRSALLEQGFSVEDTADGQELHRQK